MHKSGAATLTDLKQTSLFSHALNSRSLRTSNSWPPSIYYKQIGKLFIPAYVSLYHERRNWRKMPNTYNQEISFFVNGRKVCKSQQCLFLGQCNIFVNCRLSTLHKLNFSRTLVFRAAMAISFNFSVPSVVLIVKSKGGFQGKQASFA